MLAIVVLAVLLTFVAAVGLWMALFCLREAGRRRSGRGALAASALLNGIHDFRRTGDRKAFADAVAVLDPGLLLDLVPRALSELAAFERDAFETALARRRFARHLRTHFRRFDETRRILACELLAVLGGERSTAFLLGALRDRAYRVRIAAAIGLSRRSALADLGEVVGVLGKRARRSTRLVQMFAHSLPERRLEVAAVAGDSAQDPFVRVSALKALAAGGVFEEALALRLSRDASAVVIMAVGALSVDYRYACAPLILERMLASPSPAVRREAAARSRGMGNEPLAVRLNDALGDRDPSVVSAAARALVAAKGAHSDSPLLCRPAASRLTVGAHAAE